MVGDAPPPLHRGSPFCLPDPLRPRKPRLPLRDAQLRPAPASREEVPSPSPGRLLHTQPQEVPRRKRRPLRRAAPQSGYRKPPDSRRVTRVTSPPSYELLVIHVLHMSRGVNHALMNGNQVFDLKYTWSGVNQVSRGYNSTMGAFDKIYIRAID